MFSLFLICNIVGSMIYVLIVAPTEFIYSVVVVVVVVVSVYWGFSLCYILDLCSLFIRAMYSVLFSFDCSVEIPIQLFLKLCSCHLLWGNLAILIDICVQLPIVCWSCLSGRSWLEVLFSFVDLCLFIVKCYISHRGTSINKYIYIFLMNSWIILLCNQFHHIFVVW